MNSRLLPQSLASRLQRVTSQGAYTDKALLLIPVATGTYDEYNQAVVTITQVPIDCSFSDTLLVRDMEQWRDHVDVELVNATLRYEGTTPSKGWKVKLVSRFDGVPYKDEREYEIVAIQNRATFGFVLALKAVTL